MISPSSDADHATASGGVNPEEDVGEFKPQRHLLPDVPSFWRLDASLKVGNTPGNCGSTAWCREVIGSAKEPVHRSFGPRTLLFLPHAMGGPGLGMNSTGSQ